MERLIGPMAVNGYEALGSMGNDQALACLSLKPRLAFDYFQQLFAQVMSPPVDPIRESIGMSLKCPIGPQANLLAMSSEACHRVMLDSPILTPETFYFLCHITTPGWAPTWLDMTFAIEMGPSGVEQTIRRLCEEAATAVQNNVKLIVLSDRASSPQQAPVFSLLAAGAVHQHLVKTGLRSQVGIIVESGDVSEVHHHC